MTFSGSLCLYIRADKDEDQAHTQELSPVDSLMAHNLNECIKCAVVALLPVD